MKGGPEDLLREIARIEKDIEELLDYRSEMEGRHRDAEGWWARYKASLQYVLIRRQVENHLRYLRLQLRLNQTFYDESQQDAPRPTPPGG